MGSIGALGGYRTQKVNMEVNTDHTEIYRGHEAGCEGHKAACNGIKIIPGGSIGAMGWGSLYWHCGAQTPYGTAHSSRYLWGPRGPGEWHQGISHL